MGYGAFLSIVCPFLLVFISIFSMQCNFSEAIKALGLKSRNTLYRLEEKGVLKPYLSTINGQKYLEMGKVKGKTLAQTIRNNLTSNNWVEINDYDLHLYIKLASSN